MEIDSEFLKTRFTYGQLALILLGAKIADEMHSQNDEIMTCRNIFSDLGEILKLPDGNEYTTEHLYTVLDKVLQ